MEKPVIAQKKPYVMDMEAGTYAWCACGKSKKQPFCDGSHKGSGFSPIIEKFEGPKKVAWCGCKQSKTPPYCDGSHTNL